MSYITFAPKDTAGGDLEQAVVSVARDSSHELVVAGELFGAATLDVELNVIQLDVGDYYLWARAAGWIFPFPLAITIAPGDGPDALNPRVIDITATGSTVKPSQAVAQWSRIFGWCGVERAGNLATRRALAYGIVERRPSGQVVRSERAVEVIRIGASRDGESESLAGKESMTLAVDPNGYYEVIVEPETLYAIAVPNVRGVRYFTTPAAGVSSDVETLIDAGRSAAPYDMIIGGP